jgi:hypothetical protein
MRSVKVLHAISQQQLSLAVFHSVPATMRFYAGGSIVLAFSQGDFGKGGEDCSRSRITDDQPTLLGNQISKELKSWTN